MPGIIVARILYRSWQCNNKNSRQIGMKVSLVVCTYNWPSALEAVLNSVAQQTIYPDEVVIADDGSTDDTRELIERMRLEMPFKILHVWQEDKGFRLAMSLNRAFAKCTGDYIIKIDGDIIMERHFIEDHIRRAKSGCFLCGSRSKLTEERTLRIFKTKDITLSPWSNGIRRRLNVVRLPWLAAFFYDYNHGRGCNMSFWRNDLYAVNGFDNDIVGYGREDTDFIERMKRYGVKQRFMKFCCVQYHLYHKDTPSKLDKGMQAINDNHLNSNTEKRVIRIENGIDKLM